MGHAVYGAAGVGAGPPSVLEDQVLGTYGGKLQNSSARPAPYEGGYGDGAGDFGRLAPRPWYMRCCVWRIWRLRRYGSAVRVLGMGMSNGGVAPGGVGVGESAFDDTHPQFPTTPDILCGDSLYGLLSAGRSNGRMELMELVWVEDPVAPIRLRGILRALVSSLGCSPPSTLVEVLPPRPRLRRCLVVLERMRRGIPKQ